MGFEGVIVSGALEMGGFTGRVKYEDRIISAFLAGNDVMLWPGANNLRVIERAVNEGGIPVERIDDSVRRILTLKARLGLAVITSDGFDPSAPMLVHSTLELELTAKAQCVARDVAEKSITLVRNEEQQLSLDPQKTKRVSYQSCQSCARLERFFG